MKLINTPFSGLYLIKNFYSNDERGIFIKTFSKKFYDEFNFDFQIMESYFSLNKKNVIRGMHFQTPPYDHTKIVSVIQGSIIDVVLDIRKNSKTYGKYFEINLNSKDMTSILIPKGFAHGFVSLMNNTILEYKQTTEYNEKNDTGILYTSFGYDWKINNEIISKRDLEFQDFSSYVSPF